MGSSPILSTGVFGKVHVQKNLPLLPCGVTGNTPVSGTGIVGSNPTEAAITK